MAHVNLDTRPRVVHMQVYENELLGFFFKPAGAEKVEISRQLGSQAASVLREAIAATLLDEQAASPSLFQTHIADIEPSQSFKSILFKQGRANDNRKIVVFNFKDAFNDTALPLLGLLIAAFSGPLKLETLPEALEVVKGLWGKLIVLRTPQDADAIRLLDALGRVGAADIAAAGQAPPTWATLLAASGLPAADALTALKLLQARGVLEIARWGGQEENLEDPGNRWRVAL